MPRYRRILAEFGYSAGRDREAAARLDAALADPLPAGRIAEIVAGRTVLVAGAGPSLHRLAGALRRRGMPRGAALVSADSATGTLLDAGAVPDVVVTDLDGGRASLERAAAEGSAMVVHAHGDNIEEIAWAAGSLGRRCMGTAQCMPVGSLHNFGGFTDGDRAAFLADSLGAARIVLCGMDVSGVRIGSASGTPAAGRAAKLKKLAWARRLLEWLAQTSRCGLLTASDGPIAGFERAAVGDVLAGCRRPPAAGGADAPPAPGGGAAPRPASRRGPGGRRADARAGH